jgi:outer membrane protein assembly factor BamD (BamD/ComL family)
MVFKTFAASCLIATSACAQTTKKYKDQAEYQLYDAAAKDLAANNFTKAIADLDAWSKTYVDSDFKDDRQVLYVQAYAGAKQTARAIDAAGPLLSKQDMDATSIIKLLFTRSERHPAIPIGECGAARHR